MRKAICGTSVTVGFTPIHFVLTSKLDFGIGIRGIDSFLS